MASIFNLTIPQLRQWSRRQVTDHRQLNEPVEALNRMTTGVGVPQQVAGVPLAAGISATAQFKLAQDADTHADYLVCHTWDWTTEGVEDVLIAKPWLLRQTPFDGQVYNGVHYAYVLPTRRTASIFGDTEEQIIIPPYVVGGVLRADKNIEGGTGVIWLEQELEWEARYASRAWTAEYIKSAAL